MKNEEQILEMLEKLEFFNANNTRKCYSLYGKMIEEDIFHIDFSLENYDDSVWRVYRPLLDILSLRLL